MTTMIKDLRGAADYIKAQVPIVDVIAKETHIEHAGADLWKGLCCFHEEKTPSFTVTPSKGMYHCFGCKAGGDVITFIQKRQNMSPIEVIRKLADEYNVNISAFEREPTPEELERMTLENINKDTRDYLTDVLLGSSNRGYEYLAGERGLTPEVIRTFGLGYSRSLSDSMARAGQSDRLATLLELDRDFMWTDAISYPLHDPYGKVIGFKTRPYWGGRTTDDQGRKLPKFVGTSSRSPLHSDSHIYGLHIARKHITKGQIIGVEGQHDVIRLHQEGMLNTVGTDGTTLNKEKMAILEEFGVREIVLLYDGDAAGREASVKVARESSEIVTSIAVKIARLPDGYDPDEFVAAFGAIMLHTIISRAVYASQYLIDQIAEAGLDNVTQRIDFIRRVQPIILKAPSAEQTFLITYVAERAKTSRETIEDMIREQQAKSAKSLLYNIAGEKIVLGAMMRDEDFRIAALVELHKEDLFLPKHQEVFALVAKLTDSDISVNIDTLRMAMNNAGLNQLLQEGVVIDEIYATMGDYATIKDDLIDKAVRRKLIKAGDDLKLAAQDLSNRLVLVTEEHIGKIQASIDTTTDDGLTDSKQEAQGFMDTLHKRMANPGQIVGVPMGDNWRNSTKILNGLQKKSLITIAANQSVGKTTLLANWLDDICVTQRRPWVHFSLEMPSAQVTLKMIGLRAGVDSSRIQVGNLTNEEYGKVQRAAAEYYAGKLLLNDKATTLERIIAETRKLIRSEGIEGISIDYIQLVKRESNKFLKKYEEEGEISGALKNDVAKALNLPVVILSQMSRGAKDKDTPTAEDGAGAYKISQDSDQYMILFEKKQEEIERYGIEKGNMTLFIDKNRLGQADAMIDLLFERDIQRIIEVV